MIDHVDGLESWVAMEEGAVYIGLVYYMYVAVAVVVVIVVVCAFWLDIRALVLVG